MLVKCESSLEAAPFPHVSSGCDPRSFPHRLLDPEQDCRPLVIGSYVHDISPCPGFDVASERHARSVHVDLDEFHSRLRALVRQAGSADEWM
jgi:hypothetical protein